MNKDLYRANSLRHDAVAKLRNSLLDSNLIVTTNIHSYDLKVIDCGNYIQVYSKSNSFVKHDNTLEEFKHFDISLINTDNLKKTNTSTSNYSCNDNVIEKKNIIRSKLECQRLAKSNSDCWKTFITLTFKDNIIDIDKANKKFRNFIDSVKRDHSELKYICIPEFQKRGAVHYHLLSNISIDSKLITIQKVGKINFYHVKHWLYGFNKVDNISGDIKKIIGYISKYMTKDVDNRLFNRHRYFYSRNINKPIVNYIRFSNENEKLFYMNLIKDKKIIYENNYISSYYNDNINFKEYF